MLLSDLLQGLVVGQGRVGGSETRVGGEVDTLGLAELDESGRGAVDVGLTLVDGGDGLGLLQQSLQVLETEVGDTDGPSLGRGDLLHLPPGVNKVPVLVDLGLSLTVDGVCSMSHDEEDQSGRTENAQKARMLTDGNGPVHQDQVDVVGSETLERLVNNLGDILVLHVVDLGGEEDLLSGNARVLDTGTNLGLVTVSLSAVGQWE